MGAVLLFLYVPVIVMAVMSFNASPLYQLPIEFLRRMVPRLADNDQLLPAAWSSLRIAVISPPSRQWLGTAASLAFHRYDFQGKAFLQAMLFPPIAIPWLITGTAMLIFFFAIGIGRGTHAMILGHVALALPYVIVVVSARLRTFSRSSRRPPARSAPMPGR